MQKDDAIDAILAETKMPDFSSFLQSENYRYRFTRHPNNAIKAEPERKLGGGAGGGG